jgi:hypothetical protein
MAMKLKELTMNKEFVPYEEALALNQLGFNEPCFAWYVSKDHGLEIGKVIKSDLIKEALLAPLYHQAFRFFRDNYNLRGFIGFRPNSKQYDHHVYDMSLSGKEYAKQRTQEDYNKDPLSSTYEEAELNCIRTLIKMVESHAL